MNISTPYNKAVVAFIGFLASVLPLVGIDVLNDPTLQTAITSLLTTLLVYLVPNKPTEVGKGGLT